MKKTIIIQMMIVVALLPLIYAASPTIDNVATDSAAYNPTENSTTAVTIKFNVTDNDGTANLNNSACRCDVDDQATLSGGSRHWMI